MEKKKSYKSISGHSLEDLKHYHNEATNFFGAELMMLKDVIPKITDERQSKVAVLLISCTQTGAALLQLANQTDSFTTESIMLSRAFMEKITNFCYASICEEKEYRAFILHPIYKQYHYLGSVKRDDDVGYERIGEAAKMRKEKQEKFKENAIVQEALDMFSDKNPKLNWTKKTLHQRIEVLEKWGKFLDVFFRLSKIEYYSDASEALHGSLYGCCYGIGLFDPDFDQNRKDELDKKLYKDSACNLLHLGMLIHEVFTLISYSADIKEIWDHSYNNRGMALNLKFHVLEKEIPISKNKKT
ncbi:hypothetical protein [Flavobacterium sp. ZS1P14]|uniref:hypothetical protein n=1 Tax=Flavobacterium sp. ZS1P14 TaxID=3401729 RepID=UPI003AAC712C